MVEEGEWWRGELEGEWEGEGEGDGVGIDLAFLAASAMDFSNLCDVAAVKWSQYRRMGFMITLAT